MQYQYQVALLAIVLLFGVVAGQHNHDQHDHHRVNVAVYYESLCPDSIKFFTQQLYPSLQGNLSSYVNLTLLPYGRSKTVKEFNQFEFTCHHGPAECHGNRLQVCALKLIDNGRPTGDLSYNKIATGFINCLMDKVQRNGDNTTFPTLDCATINHVQDYKQIENCANDVVSSTYLNEVGVQTQALSPPLTSVPTIVFNGQYKKDDNDLSQTNFVKALCQYIHGDKPAECTRSAAPNTSQHVAVVMAIAALAISSAKALF